MPRVLLITPLLNSHPITSSHSPSPRHHQYDSRERNGRGEIWGEKLSEVVVPVMAAVASQVVEREGKSYWGMGARECDSCKVTPALLFCRADSAFLCSHCDSKVHGANKLASRHERVWMCEVCEQAPAAVTCKADAAALCVTCDADIHSANPLARRHERLPVVPFFDSKISSGKKGVGLMRKTGVVVEEVEEEEEEDEENDDDEKEEAEAEAEAASWLMPNSGGCHTETKSTPVVDRYFFSDADPYIDIDYAGSADPRFHQTTADSVVPVQNRSIGSGMALGVAAIHHHHPPPLITAVPDSSYDIDFARSKPSYSYAPSHSMSSSEVGVVPDGSTMTDISNPYAGQTGGVMTSAPAAVVVGLDREARVMRYREKRKNRRFEKTIRYASRKAYAETRPRIKGRFAKRTEMEGDGDVLRSNSGGLMVDYGVVPTF